MLLSGPFLSCLGKLMGGNSQIWIGYGRSGRNKRRAAAAWTASPQPASSVPRFQALNSSTLARLLPGGRPLLSCFIYRCHHLAPSTAAASRLRLTTDHLKPGMLSCTAAWTFVPLPRCTYMGRRPTMQPPTNLAGSHRLISVGVQPERGPLSRPLPVEVGCLTKIKTTAKKSKQGPLVQGAGSASTTFPLSMPDRGLPETEELQRTFLREP